MIVACCYDFKLALILLYVLRIHDFNTQIHIHIHTLSLSFSASLFLLGTGSYSEIYRAKLEGRTYFTASKPTPTPLPGPVVGGAGGSYGGCEA